MYFLGAVLLGFLPAVGVAISEFSHASLAAASLIAVGVIAEILLVPLLLASWLYVGVLAARDDRTGTSTVRRALKHWAPILKIYYVTFLASSASLIPGLLAFGFAHSIDPRFRGAGIPIAAIAGSVTFVAYFYVLVRFGFAIPVCMDYSLGTTDSIRLSLRLTENTWGTLLMLALTLWLISAATALCLYLPYFFVGLPLVSATWGVAYTMASSGIAESDERLSHFRLPDWHGAGNQGGCTTEHGSAP